MHLHYYISRTLCEVLKNMRECDKTKNYGPIASLIAEAQCMGDRMEAALSYQRDLEEMHQEWSKLKDAIKELKSKKRKLVQKKGNK